MQQSPSRRKAGRGAFRGRFSLDAFKGWITGGTGNFYGLRRLHIPARYNTMVLRSSGPRLRTWPSRAPPQVQDVEANDYAARHGCPVQSLRRFPGCPAAWPFPVNPACPCP